MASTGGIQLCFGCLHPFPQQGATDQLLTPVESFDRELTSRLQSLRNLISKVAPSNAQTRQCIAGMEDELKNLTLSVDRELRAKQKVIDELTVQVKFFSAHEEEQRRRAKLAEQQRASAKPQARAQASSDGGPMYSSKRLQRFISASLAAPDTPRDASEGTALDVENRFGESVALRLRSPRDAGGASAHGTSPRHDDGSGRRARGPTGGPRPLDLVSATLYTTLEFATVRTKAAIGVIWLRREDNDELLAPFLIGAEVKQTRFGTAPHHIRTASTTAGTVATTGIAVNVLAPPSGSKSPEPLTAALEATQRSTLMMPIFKKYAETSRECVGVLQLIAWGDASPFSVADESTAALAADVVSHTVGMYHQALIGEWTSRTFDPTPMTKAASFMSALDSERGAILGSEFGGMGECISAVKSPYLIFRSDPQGRPHGAPGSSPAGESGGATTDEASRAARDANRVSRQDIVSHGVHQVSVRDALKELHRYTTSLESSWKSALAAHAELQRKADGLQEQLDRARHGLNELRRHGVGAMQATQYAASTSSLKELSDSLRRKGGSPKAKAGATFSAAELDDLENETHARRKQAAQDTRQQKVRAEAILDRTKPMPAPRPPGTAQQGRRATTRGGGTAFITQPRQ